MASRTSRRSSASPRSTRRSAARSPPRRLRPTATTRSAPRARRPRGSATPRRCPSATDPMAASATSTEAVAPILRLRGVGRRFGGVVAVKDVDLDVRPGERRAILGPNGAGKTTLFNLISGEFPPTAGTVELFGSDVTALPARKRARRGLSRTFQTSRLFGGLSVEDNLYLAVLGVHDGHLRPVRNAADEEMREKGRAMADAVGLSDKLDVLVAELSHGEQRPRSPGASRPSARGQGREPRSPS